MSGGEVLVVQHVAPEGPARIGEALARAGHAVRPVRVFAGEAVPTAVDGLAGLVVLGGPMGVGDRHALAHLRDELALIDAALAHGLPVLGICLGSQLLAHALGGDVRPTGELELGWAPIALTPAAAHDPAFGVLPRTPPALHWHGDAFTLPPGATSLASSARTPHQAFRHGAALGLLCHLEADAAQVAAMAAAFPDDVAAAGTTAEALRFDTARHDRATAGHAAALFDAWAASVG